MSQLRHNPLTDRWVAIAAERAARPGDFAPRRLEVEADPNRPCPFCPGHEDETAQPIETYGPEGAWLVRVVPNLYPAFSGIGPLTPSEAGPLWVQAPGSGCHEVLVLSPDHTTGWDGLDHRQVALVMAALRDRMEDHGRERGVAYTQAIVNHGREAGASLEHPHGQLLGIPFVPNEILDEIAGFDRHGPDCVLCRLIDDERDAGHRVVLETEAVLVICPFWAASPYELLVLPRSHDAHLAGTEPRMLVGVGDAIGQALARLRRVVGDVAYNIVVHTAPHHEDPLFHWHVHVIPRLSSIAGFEQGTGVMINIVAPERASEQLRAADGS